VEGPIPESRECTVLHPREVIPDGGTVMDRIKVVAGSALVLVLLGPFRVALADDPCPVTDPNCIVGTADQAVNGTEGTTDDTTQAVIHEVQTTVDDVQSTVRDLLGSGDQPGGGDGDGGNGKGGRDSGGLRHDGSGKGGLRHPTRGSVTSSAGTGVPSPATAPTLVATTSDRLADDASAGTGISGVLREAAIGIALPLVVVLLLLLVFTAIQDRLDRRDPKLALAPLATDVLRFE
jgi:hypothetical protein